MHCGEKMVQESAVISTMSEREGRKWSKPVMEKRRRERINKSLEELKRLVLEAQHRDSSRYTKLEKADILEMTVKHLRSLRNRRKCLSSGQILSQTVIPDIRIGCCRCINEMDPSVTTNDGVTMGPCRTQPQSRNANQNNDTAIKYESAPGSFRMLSPRVANPARQDPAVQYISMCPSDYAGTMLAGSDSNSVFWRPF